MTQSVHDIFNEIMTPERAEPSVTNTSSANYLCLLMVDGIVLSYSFSSLVEYIRPTCGSLRHHTSSTLRVRYKDKDHGDFMNLNEGDTDNF